MVTFRPIYAGDVARAVEICCRDDPKVIEQVGGKVIEAGGPDGAFTVIARSHTRPKGIFSLASRWQSIDACIRLQCCHIMT